MTDWLSKSYLVGNSIFDWIQKITEILNGKTIGSNMIGNRGKITQFQPTLYLHQSLIWILVLHNFFYWIKSDMCHVFYAEFCGYNQSICQT